MATRKKFSVLFGPLLWSVSIFMAVAVNRVDGTSQTSGKLVPILAAVTMLFHVPVQGSQLTNRLFEWTRRAEDYVSEGKVLTGHTILEYQHKYVSSQCAMECLRHHQCKSFNFDPGSGKCHLNSASHEDYPADLVDHNTAEYHVREAFYIDPEALGPCATNPCNDNGHCIETKNSLDDLMAICICHDGWTGSSCLQKAHTLDWGEWEEWGQCSVTCHRGWRMRKRKCIDQETGQSVSELECYGADVEYDVCIMKECPKWEEWGEWGPCSSSDTCGLGSKLRHRACANGGIPGIDRYCLGSTNESTPCQGIDCTGPLRLQGGTAPGEGQVEIYNDISDQWGSVCADQLSLNAADLVCRQIGFPGAHAVVKDGHFGVSDNNYIALTDIQCQGGENTLLQCRHNDWSVNSTCNAGTNMAAGVQCNVNGAWSLWGSWSGCSVTCENGTRHRTRTCNHPSQMYGGKGCEGEDIQYKPCQLDMCPSNGTWGEWGVWTTCQAQCGPGFQTRARTCISSQPCVGSPSGSRECDAGSCAVNGMWNDWTQWSSCSLTCGNGTQDRTRTCHGPFHGGKNCTGEDWQRQQCKVVECPVDGKWEEWGTWSACSLTCGNGTRSRTRSCLGPFFDGKPCVGKKKDSEPCNTYNCPVDGEWFQWEQWQSCNVSCGGGSQVRERKCNTPQFGGKTCNGTSTDLRSCGHDPCPMDGVWLAWLEWGACSVSCGDGVQQRNRTCDGPYYGGDDCVGNKTDYQPCHLRMCPVDGHWMDWEAWAACTVSCGGGQRVRTRVCYNGLHGGKSCDGEASETEVCQTQGCPVDGVWLPWTDWSICSQTCGNGQRVRNRACQGPFHEGANCTGSWDESESCNPDPCPVDGIIAEWTEWSECSLTCGGGQRTRWRECYGPFYRGKVCFQHLTENEDCNQHPCPVDGVWGDWSAWEDCSVTCGGGTSSRLRTCNGPYHGGAACVGKETETVTCNVRLCPVDGVWHAWSDWQRCSVACGGGSQWRHRACQEPIGGGAECQGTANETRACNAHPCPVDGEYTQWSAWSECNVTCRGGIRWRNRTCIGPFHGGEDCQGAHLDSSSCNTQHCPVDGVWQDWGQWERCSLTCGGGKQSRSRNCTGPFHGGAPCPGPANETRSCNEQFCPEDGSWEQWTTWTVCTQSCGGGLQQRERHCRGVNHGGKNCTGDSQQTGLCNTHECPVDGLFNDWSEWSQCSLSCGGGSQWRNRTCFGPFHGGSDCAGMRNETQECNSHSCPVDGFYEDWLPWRECSVTCGGGSQIRTRTCIPPKHGGQDCQGPDNQTQSCNTFKCPVDGFYHDWSDWGQCSVECGGGNQSRSRVCEPPKYNGTDCQGPDSDSQACNTHPCPVDGVWKMWSEWSPCNTTCGGGFRERLRVCEEPKHGGEPCKGNSTEYLTCAENPCPIPGDWFPWTPWSDCTVTCDGGLRERSRQCDMTSYGALTAPCEGDAEEEEDCHTFSCIPFAHTCSEWMERGLMMTTVADIDPDGEEGTLEPVQITCDLDSQPGEAVTVMGHDSEERTRVQGWEGAREYEQMITYNISFDHVLSIIEQSESCKQFIRWECKAALIHNPNDNNKVTTGWLNRTQGLADYFGGASPGSTACACGMNASCFNEELLCNCDANDNVWRSDEGYLTFKNDLPVTAFVAGDTGGQKEDGYQTVGPVECVGAAK